MTDDSTTTPGRIDFHHHFMPTSMLTSGLFGSTSGWKFQKDEASAKNSQSPASKTS